MSAAVDHDAISPSPAYHEDADAMVRIPQTTVTHEQIIGALGRVEGLIEAESLARLEFRETFTRRLEKIEERTGTVAVEVQRLAHHVETAKVGGEKGVAHALIRLFEHQPILGLAVAGVVIALGSSGVIQIYEAFTH